MSVPVSSTTSRSVALRRLLMVFALAAVAVPSARAQSSVERARERAERERERAERDRERDRERAERDRDRSSRNDRDDDRQERQDNAFTWSGVIPNGRRIMIRNINGGVTVERSTTGKVEVTADKRWRRGNPSDVRIEQQKMTGDEVLICALWQPDSRCDEDGIHSPRNNWRRDNQNNDVSVRFLVKVPEGVRVDVSTVNGGLEVNGVTTEVKAYTVNGSIEARSAGGPVRAHTVNGSITVAMGSIGNSADLEYETTNGNVTLELPANFGAQLELSTVNGRVSTDFPITVSGTFSPRRMRGTVGNGSARVSASTVNGSVTLRKAN